MDPPPPYEASSRSSSIHSHDQLHPQGDQPHSSQPQGPAQQLDVHGARHDPPHKRKEAEGCCTYGDGTQGCMVCGDHSEGCMNCGDHSEGCMNCGDNTSGCMSYESRDGCMLWRATNGGCMNINTNKQGCCQCG
ncbi:hypothetical protein HRR77_004020 [Exophiala dermatitidis]|nr:hypothetical protein HRR77_004020 [Exophiala dermatitidis]KAJ4575434.1 hypothetical protein HRR79_002355 [Exophiala dermatitidis]